MEALFPFDLTGNLHVCQLSITISGTYAISKSDCAKAQLVEQFELTGYFEGIHLDVEDPSETADNYNAIELTGMLHYADDRPIAQLDHLFSGTNAYLTHP